MPRGQNAVSAPNAAPPAPRDMSAEAVRGFMEALRAANPEPRSELHYHDAFTLLVAVLLSAQATDASVNKVTPALFTAAPTPEAMAALGAEGIGRFIRSIGLWQSKARHLAELARILVEKHGGKVPCDREALESLPGVGRKTANVVLNIACGEPTIAVDTHIFRVANRTGLAPGRTPREVEEALLRRLPPEFHKNAHHWLILHGRYICTARRPRCEICPVARFCLYEGKTASPEGTVAQPAERKPKPAPAPASAAAKAGATKVAKARKASGEARGVTARPTPRARPRRKG